MEKVFALDHVAPEELQFESVKQRPLSPESLKVKQMTRYNRFHNMKNDSYIHDIVGNVQRVPKTTEVSGVRQ